MKYIIKSIFIVILISVFSCSSDDDSNEPEAQPEGTGKIIFYSFNDMNCGAITVVLTGQGNGTLDSTKLPSNVVFCQDEHTSMYYFRGLPQGDYNFTASCSGYNWSGTITLGNGSCYCYALTLGSST